MSSPLSTLGRARKHPNRQMAARMFVPQNGIERQKTILKTNTDEELMAEIIWSPPENWMTDVDDFTTTDDNLGWRKARAVMALQYLLKETVELMEQPSQYIPDIWWFRYLSSVKHMKVENPLAIQKDFVRLGLPKLFKTFWSDYLCITNIDRWKDVHEDSVEALYHMTMALWFISTNPTHQQNMFDELGVFILDMISSRAFRHHYPKVKRSQDCLKALLGIVYQFSKNIDSAKEAVRAHGSVALLQNIASRKSGFNRNVKGRAQMILAFVLSEEEQKGVDAAESVIAFLISLLKDCLLTEDHKSKTFNYQAIEILDGLNRLAISDTNKIKINDSDGLSLYLEFLKSCSLDEQVEACKGLWTLCFCELVAENVANDAIMISVLQSLAKSKHDTLKTAACGCLWTVQKLKDARQTEESVNKAGHVMISYNWSLQAEAKEIKSKLHDSGYRVWMDIENMSGSTLSAMSQAIEKATVVLILLSEQYKTSPACRAEAEYAYKLGREIIPLQIQQGYSPDGWLGMLIGMKMSFDLTDPDPVEKQVMYEQLIAALGEKGKRPPIEFEAKTVEPAAVHQPQKSAEPLQKPAEPVQKPVEIHTKSQISRLQSIQLPVADLECMCWDEEVVTGWIEKHKLQDLTTGLGDITGDILSELRYMLLKETEHYYKLTRTDLKLPAVAVLRLSAALRRLK